VARHCELCQRLGRWKAQHAHGEKKVHAIMAIGSGLVLDSGAAVGAGAEMASELAPAAALSAGPCHHTCSSNHLLPSDAESLCYYTCSNNHLLPSDAESLWTTETSTTDATWR